MIVLNIPKPTPSLNRMLGEHWAKKGRVRKEWAWLVRAARLEAKVHVRPKWSKATITIERHGSRILDADNFRGGTKFLTDSLVKEGFITDDKPEVIGEPILKQYAGKRRETIVTIAQA